MRMPGLGLFNTLKHYVMGSRESDTTSMVLYDRTLLWLTFGLAIIGFVMVTSASMPIGQRLANDPFLFAKRDALYLALAFGLSLVTLRIPMDVWQRYSNIMLLISIVLLLVVLVVGSSVNGGITLDCTRAIAYPAGRIIQVVSVLLFGQLSGAQG